MSSSSIPWSIFYVREVRIEVGGGRERRGEGEVKQGNEVRRERVKGEKGREGKGREGSGKIEVVG